MILEKFLEKFLKESHHRWRIWGNSSLLLLGLNYKCPQWISRLSYQDFQYPTQKFPALASKRLSLFFNLILNYFIFIISFLISDIWTFSVVETLESTNLYGATVQYSVVHYERRHSTVHQYITESSTIRKTVQYGSRYSSIVP